MNILRKLLKRSDDDTRSRPAGLPMTSKGADRAISGSSHHDIDPETIPLFKPSWQKYKSQENQFSGLTPNGTALNRVSNNQRAQSLIEAVASGRDPYRALD